MEFQKAPTCYNCSEPMSFMVRISLPGQVAYRCEFCKVEEWIRQPKASPLREQHLGQQQQQPQVKLDED